MRILVTGGLGTLGSPLIRELHARNHDIVCLDLAHTDNEHAFSIRGDEDAPGYVRCDVGEFRQLERAISETGPFDIVYHAAAEFGRWNGEDFYEQVWKTNAVGTKNVIRLQEKLGFKLVHFSSSEVYGDYPHLMVESVMDEFATRQLSDYAMSKWVNEQQITNSAAQFGTESVVVRIFNVYGPGEFYSPYRSVNCRFAYCGVRGIPWTVHRGHHRTSLYIDDAIRTLANISGNFRPGETYNIAGDHLHTIEEVSEIVARETGHNLAIMVGEEAMTTRVKCADTTKAQRDLDHQTTVSLEDGMQRTISWMRQTYGVRQEACI